MLNEILLLSFGHGDITCVCDNISLWCVSDTFATESILKSLSTLFWIFLESLLFELFCI